MKHFEQVKLLNLIKRWKNLISFREKMAFCACLVESGLEDIFHLKIDSGTLRRSELRLLVEMFVINS